MEDAATQQPVFRMHDCHLSRRVQGEETSTSIKKSRIGNRCVGILRYSCYQLFKRSHDALGGRSHWWCDSNLILLERTKVWAPWAEPQFYCVFFWFLAVSDCSSFDNTFFTKYVSFRIFPDVDFRPGAVFWSHYSRSVRESSPILTNGLIFYVVFFSVSVLRPVALELAT